MKVRFTMKNTTLCYLEKNGAYLMLHRTKKENDENKDKWIGIGGKFESGETPYECAYREILEETGLKPNSLSYRGIVTFVSDIYGTEYMHLFKATDFCAEMLRDGCDEGELVWIEKSKIEELNIWEGDKIFLRLLDTEKRFFSLKLVYDKDGRLLDSVLEF